MVVMIWDQIDIPPPFLAEQPVDVEQIERYKTGQGLATYTLRLLRLIVAVGLGRSSGRGTVSETSGTQLCSDPTPRDPWL